MIRQIYFFIHFELRLALLSPAGIWSGVLYFLVSLMIFPFTVSLLNINLSDIAPTIIWISLIPSIILSCHTLFIQDLEDGFMDRYGLMGFSFTSFFVLKVFTLMLSVLVPLLLALPLTAFLFSLTSDMICRLYIGLLVSLPAILFFTAFGALLSVHGRMGHLLSFLIILPLIIPAIILGTAFTYSPDPIADLIRLPLIFSCLSALICVPASAFLYQQLFYYR